MLMTLTVAPRPSFDKRLFIKPSAAILSQSNIIPKTDSAAYLVTRSLQIHEKQPVQDGNGIPNRNANKAYRFACRYVPVNNEALKGNCSSSQQVILSEIAVL